MQITTVGLDLAKNVFQVHGVNEHGKVVLRLNRPVCRLLACALRCGACFGGLGSDPTDSFGATSFEPRTSVQGRGH